MLKKEIHTIIMTAANADTGLFQNPTPCGSFLSYQRALKRLEKLIAKEKGNLNSRYDAEERDESSWEMYDNGEAAACFVRIEVITYEIEDWSMDR